MTPMNQIAAAVPMPQPPTPPSLAAIEQVLIKGDLSGLTEAQRLTHYKNVCDSLGLNPLTTPFEYLKLSGKLVLYAKREATEQLRKIHGVSITGVTATRLEDVYVVTACARNAQGREDAGTGAVTVAGLKGENLANALMKAETKAKRRVTLSICGLGMLDESELDTIPTARPMPFVAPAPFSPAREAFQAEVLEAGVPAGQVVIKEVKPGDDGLIKGIAITHQGEELLITKEDILKIAQELAQSGQPMVAMTSVGRGRTSGKNFVREFMSPEAVVYNARTDRYEPPAVTIAADDIPF